MLLFDESSIVQYKLTSGAELVGEVMEWPEQDGHEVVLRNIMQIVIAEYNDGERVYVFKPFIHYLENNLEYTVLNTQHVITTNHPNELLLYQYKAAVLEMHEIAKQRIAEHQKEQEANLYRVAKAIARATGLANVDSAAPANVISFPKPTDIIH